MTLTLGFSPCPNDTFIFDALIHKKIDTEGLNFEVSYEDVETLNQKALKGELDITKLSFHAYAFVIDNYVLLDSGSALGFGVGPLLIAKQEVRSLKSGVRSLKLGSQCSQLSTPNSILSTQYSHLKVGIPGKYTTANFLLGIAFPQLQNKQEMVFSEIEQALLDEKIDLGLIIHENRFTYQDKGLKKVIDLGDFWEKETGSAIPLGGIMIKRNLPDEIKRKVNRLIRKSVEFAFANPKSGLEFIRLHAQEMSEEVMYKHIDLYVNKYSVDLGEEGRKAVETLFNKATEAGVIPAINQSVFLNNISPLKEN